MKGKSSKPLFRSAAALRGVCLLTAVLALLGCHGNSSGSNADYTVGGTITGLNAGSVVLIYNSSTTVSVAAGATTWIFPGSFAANSSYAVTVLTQPAGELCEVTSGGTATTLTVNVSDVTVACSVYGQWTWEGA